MVTKKTKKPTVAVYKFSSCDGCQLSILNMEEELLDLVGVVEIAYFLEARRQTLPGPYDIVLVEGSVSTQDEVERIKQIRQNAGMLVALGTCATGSRTASPCQSCTQDAPLTAFLGPAGSAGSQTVKTAPPPGLFSAPIDPRCSSTIRWAIESPRPVPPLRRLKNGTKRRRKSAGSIPGPSSVMLHSTPAVASEGWAESRTTEPRGACWMAFARMFWKTCSRRAGS